MSTYLYGIVGAGHPAKIAGLAGVGDPPTGLRVVPADPLAVVAGDAPESLRAKRRDLLAHERVLEALCDQGPTVPMRFGVIAESDAAVRDHVSAQEQRYQQLLDEVTGRIEINVKIAHHEDRALRRVLSADPGLGEMNEALRAGGGGHDDRVRFGEQVAVALSELERSDTETLLRPLREHAVRDSEGPAVAGCFVNSSFLVDRNELAGFEAAVDALRESAADEVDIRCHGPLPPYSFTDPVAAG